MTFESDGLANGVGADEWRRVVPAHKLHGTDLVPKLVRAPCSEIGKDAMVNECAVPHESRTRLRHDHDAQEGI